MVALLDALEGKGLVTRRPDVVDRRRNVVDLTDTGRATLRQATSASDEAERRLLAVLNDDEATLLRRLLTRLATGESAARSPTGPATPASCRPRAQ
jgi:DNA-binding MarR family transcriptional regulator